METAQTYYFAATCCLKFYGDIYDGKVRAMSTWHILEYTNAGGAAGL